MIRIVTRFGKAKVFTVFHRNEWITIMSGYRNTQSAANASLFDAGQKHLEYCTYLKNKLSEK